MTGTMVKQMKASTNFKLNQRDVIQLKFWPKKLLPPYLPPILEWFLKDYVTQIMLIMMLEFELCHHGNTYNFRIYQIENR